MRSCVGCRTRRPSVDLLRLTRRADDHVIVVDGPSAGRGAWVCRDTAVECIDRARRARQFDRVWRTGLSDDDHAAIEAEIQRAIGSLTNDGAADGAAHTTDGAAGASVGMTTGKG